MCSRWLYTPLFLVTGVGLGLGWALANVKTQAVVKPAEVGAASGVTLTCLAMLGAVSVAIAAAMVELLSASVAGAASDAAALITILRTGAPRSLSLVPWCSSRPARGAHKRRRSSKAGASRLRARRAARRPSRRLFARALVLAANSRAGPDLKSPRGGRPLPVATSAALAGEIPSPSQTSNA